LWNVVGLGMRFKESGLDLDRKIWQCAHLWSILALFSCWKPTVKIQFSAGWSGWSVADCRDEYWTGPGLDCIWTMTNFVDFGQDLGCKLLH